MCVFVCVCVEKIRSLVDVRLGNKRTASRVQRSCIEQSIALAGLNPIRFFVSFARSVYFRSIFCFHRPCSFTDLIRYEDLLIFFCPHGRAFDQNEGYLVVYRLDVVENNAHQIHRGIVSFRA